MKLDDKFNVTKNMLVSHTGDQCSDQLKSKFGYKIVINIESNGKKKLMSFENAYDSSIKNDFSGHKWNLGKKLS